MAGSWVGYELEYSEAAIHTVARAPSATLENNTNSGSAALTVAGDWVVGWGSGGSGSGWVKYDFGTPILIKAIKIRADAMPTLDGSDDNVAYTNIPLTGVSPIGGTVSEAVIDLGAGETYRWFALSIGNWKNIQQVEFYVDYDPGEMRFWGNGAYQTNYADHAFNDAAGNFYVDGGAQHYLGWMFLEEGQAIDTFTIELLQNRNTNLEFSDNGFDWNISDTALPLLADTPYEFTPASNNHKHWRIPVTNWEQVKNVAYVFETPAAPEPDPEPDAPTAGFSDGGAQSYRLNNLRRKWGRSQYWK